MKRSEMLLKLMEMMVEAPDNIEAAADDILTRLERAGMLPPQYIKTGTMALYGTQVETVKPANEWERE